VWDALDGAAEVTWLEDAGTSGEVLRPLVLEGLAPYCRASDPLARLRGLDDFRVLCAHRRGPGSVDALNGEIERLLAERGVIDLRQGPWYDGRPILVTHNDYAVRLFNGDVGVIAHSGESSAARRACFLDSDGGVRAIAPARLPPHETVFAMSVHKSQGSEFDTVLIVLPPEPSPLLSRELLYTAVTRARRRVILVGTRAVIAHAIAHRLQRASGLRERLWR
jgi:exodeoxyribonuclease V alpha subunit